MRKFICFVLAMLLCFGCAACGPQPEEDITDEIMQAEQKAAWGLTLTAEDVTPAGLTLVCTQAGGEPAGQQELFTGSWFTLEYLKNGKWHSVKYAKGMNKEEVSWTAEGWVIPNGDTVKWTIDWTWLYGELPTGEYRIGKQYLASYGTGDYDEVTLYAEFTVA